MEIEPEAKNYVQLQGFFGSFEIPMSNYTVKYFSTSANKEAPNSGPYELLQLLEPMREKIAPNTLSDLGSLLQRDLNDFRVAQDLVPYLIGDEEDSISFFPAILAALVPRGFLEEEEDIEYPRPSGEEELSNSVEVSYEEHWKCERFTDTAGNATSVGRVRIDPTLSDVIVLDGQHRSNAFRVVCGAFDQDKKNDIYQPFYEGIDSLDDYTSDLPVTLIWFESSGEKIKPDKISRKLFVDVNNSARQVSKSRTILLNDLEPSSLVTRFFYSKVAKENSFNVEEFSLLHSAFDIDSDIALSAGHQFTLTTPQIFHYTVDWLLFGSRRYVKYDQYEVQREMPRTNFSQCDLFLPNLRESSSEAVDSQDDDFVKKVGFGTDRGILEEEFTENLAEPFSLLFNEFELYKIHFKACKMLEEKRTSWSVLKVEVWDKIFCGGEGLYYAYREMEKNRTTSDRAETYLKAMDEIEDEFTDIRSSEFASNLSDENINKAYNFLNTKAFQVAYVMGLSTYYSQDESGFDSTIFEEATKEYINALNDFSGNNWVHILTDLKDQVLRNRTNPKMWPSFHKLILRILEESSETDFNFYSSSDKISKSPEARVFRYKIKEAFPSWCEYEEIREDALDEQEFGRALEDLLDSNKEEVESLFEECSIDYLCGIDYEKICVKKILSILETEMNENIDDIKDSFL